MPGVTAAFLGHEVTSIKEGGSHAVAEGVRVKRTLSLKIL